MITFQLGGQLGEAVLSRISLLGQLGGLLLGSLDLGLLDLHPVGLQQAALDQRGRGEKVSMFKGMFQCLLLHH